MGIVGTAEDTVYLQALAMYLHSSLVRYYIFFQVPEWGFYRQRESVVTSQVRTIPIPNFTPDQAQELAALQEAFAEREASYIKHGVSVEELHAYQNLLDETIYRLFAIPDDIVTLATEFVYVRLPLDGGKEAKARVTRPPTSDELLAYAMELRNELDDFTMGNIYHHVTMIWSQELIECSIEVMKSNEPFAITDNSVREGDISLAGILKTIQQSTGQQFSQWVYVQRGLRLFDGNRILLYKSPRLIDWTKTQAMNDANNIIEQAISARMGKTW